MIVSKHTSFRFFLRSVLAFSAMTLAASSQAAQSLRWTYAEDQDASLSHLVEEINSRTGLHLSLADFTLSEDRDLAFEHYQRYDQVVSGIAIRGMSLRLWTTFKSGTLIQCEAQVEDPATLSQEHLVFESASTLSREATGALALRWVKQSALSANSKGVLDRRIIKFDMEDLWDHGRLVRVVTAKAERGFYLITIDLQNAEVTASRYKEYPHADAHALKAPSKHPSEFNVPAMVYPFYEEFNGVRLPRRSAVLKYLQTSRRDALEDPFAALRDRRYFYSKLDPIKAATPEGQAAGYWSLPALNSQIDELRTAVPLRPNDFATGAVLRGRYVTVNIHPAAYDAFPGITIDKKYSDNVLFDWLFDTAQDDYEVVPRASFYGKPLASFYDALKRPVARPPVHDPALYINNGFDEIQVYYAVSELFEALRPMGFTDPDLAERPFNAFLFNPDIESMDNAYYDNDTINFATYSPNELNMARDNLTIWHELGHGVMDRLMGSKLDLADTGGLSEGMADFVAQMVLEGAQFQQDFPGRANQRIINHTGFFLTNEVHDDGEAYGGTMKDLLDAAISRDGRSGLKKTVDLVLEAMRLSRDHPALTADVWFERLYFADQLGRHGVRAPGEMHSLIAGALASRNFAAAPDRAQFSLSYQGQEIVAGESGSRGNEVSVELPAASTAQYDLAVRIADGANYHFTYPVSVKVFFKSGPLQGAIDWIGEDSEPQVYQIAASGDSVTVPVSINGQCDTINRTDGTCSDFAYVQLWNEGGTSEVAKKRFYLKLKTLP